MATPSALEALRVPGRLCVDPSDLTTAFPHGGTGLGLMRDHRYLPGVKTAIVTAEEFGGVPVDSYHLGDAPTLLAFLRDWDVDAIQKIHPSGTTGATSGDGFISVDVNSSARAGLQISTTFKLYFSPLDDQNPAVYFPLVFAHIDAAAEMQLAVNEEAGLAVVFVAMPDTNGRLVQVGLPEDITL